MENTYVNLKKKIPERIPELDLMFYSNGKFTIKLSMVLVG
jgi:hypothetical protein